MKELGFWLMTICGFALVVIALVVRARTTDDPKRPFRKDF